MIEKPRRFRKAAVANDRGKPSAQGIIPWITLATSVATLISAWLGIYVTYTKNQSDIQVNEQNIEKTRRELLAAQPQLSVQYISFYPLFVEPSTERSVGNRLTQAPRLNIREVAPDQSITSAQLRQAIDYYSEVADCRCTDYLAALQEWERKDAEIEAPTVFLAVTNVGKGRAANVSLTGRLGWLKRPGEVSSEQTNVFDNVVGESRVYELGDLDTGDTLLIPVWMELLPSVMASQILAPDEFKYADALNPDEVVTASIRNIRDTSIILDDTTYTKG